MHKAESNNSANLENFGRRLVMIPISVCFFLLCRHPIAPPVHVPTLRAEAGPDQRVTVGNYVVLDGSTSDRGDGDTLAFRWSALAGNPMRRVIIEDECSQTVGFVVPGTYRYTLMVNNGAQDSAPDTVTIIVTPRRRSPFADPALEVSVRYKLKWPTGDLTSEQLQQTDSLLLWSWLGKVKSLGGIEKCADLSYLNASTNQITDLSPLRNLVYMQALYVDQNYDITDISPLANLVEIQWLDMNTDLVADISALRNMRKLKYFNAMYNPISDINVLADKTSLQELYFGSSPIGNIDALSGLTKMRILFLSHCQIKDVRSLAGMTDLLYLYAPGNQFSNIDVLAGCTKLIRLYLNRNQIADIGALEYLTALDDVDLSNNRITNILPLVKNQGLGNGDLVGLFNNPLDSISVAQYIPWLRDRGVVVFF